MTNYISGPYLQELTTCSKKNATLAAIPKLSNTPHKGLKTAVTHAVTAPVKSITLCHVQDPVDRSLSPLSCHNVQVNFSGGGHNRIRKPPEQKISSGRGFSRDGTSELNLAGGGAEGN
ncbi:unnamed protein product [Larinioides sclopetarius]|uniref:Uncharacterized protein n=1 Tax=Larinioides sclopetarius TaxID=280406 RepID=A0AAV1ZB94_9ARAC